MICKLEIEVRTPGLDAAIAQAGHDIAEAIVALALVLGRTPRLASMTLTLDPQGAFAMATPINTALPQHITPAFADAAGNPVTVDSVDYVASDPTLGTLTPDADSRTGATFVAAGPVTVDTDITFTATAHQAGTPDVSGSVTGTLSAAVVVPGPLASVSLALDSQTGSARKASTAPRR